MSSYDGFVQPILHGSTHIYILRTFEIPSSGDIDQVRIGERVVNMNQMSEFLWKYDTESCYEYTGWHFLCQFQDQVVA